MPLCCLDYFNMLLLINWPSIVKSSWQCESPGADDEVKYVDKSGKTGVLGRDGIERWVRHCSGRRKRLLPTGRQFETPKVKRNWSL